MDNAIFAKWFRDQLLPNLEYRIVTVTDNAIYHGRKLEVLPAMSKIDVLNA